MDHEHGTVCQLNSEYQIQHCAPSSVISRPTCFSSSLCCCWQVGSAPFVRRRCDCLASSAPFTNIQTYLHSSLADRTRSVGHVSHRLPLQPTLRGLLLINWPLMDGMQSWPITERLARWLKWGGLSPPAPIWASMNESIKCYFMPK